MAATETQELLTKATFQGRELLAGLRQAATATDEFDRRVARLNIGAAAAGVTAGGMFLAIGKAAEAAGEDAANFGRAVANFRGQFPTADLQAFTGRLEQLTGIEDDVIASQLGLLGTFGVTADQAKRLALPILNTAEAMKAMGVTSETLSSQIGRALESGQIGRVGRLLGITQEDFAAGDKFGLVLDALTRKGGNAAVEFGQTLPGAQQRARTALKSLEEGFGALAAGPVTMLASGVATVANFFNNLPGPAKTAASVLGVTVAGSLAILSAGLRAAALYTQYLMATQARAIPVAAEYAATQAAAAAATGGGGVAAAAGGALPGLGSLVTAGAGRLALASGIATGAVGLGIGAAGVIGGGAIINATRGGPNQAAGAIGGGALEGAGVGGGIGFVAGGPVGAAIGAAVGAVSGAIVAAGAVAAEKAQVQEDRIGAGAKKTAEFEKLEQMVTILTEQNRILRQGFAAPVDVSGTSIRVPEAELARALRAQFAH